MRATRELADALSKTRFSVKLTGSGASKELFRRAHDAMFRGFSILFQGVLSSVDNYMSRPAYICSTHRLPAIRMTVKAMVLYLSLIHI